MKVANVLLLLTSHSHSLNTQYRFINLDAQVTFYFHLATQTPMILLLFTAEMSLFRRKNLTAAFYNLAFTLTARTFTTTSR